LIYVQVFCLRTGFLRILAGSGTLEERLAAARPASRGAGPQHSAPIWHHRLSHKE